MKALWPRRLAGQMIILILLGLGISQILALAIFRYQHQGALRSLGEDFILTRITSVVYLLADTPAELHGRIVRTAGSRLLRFAIAGTPLLDAATSDSRALRLQADLASMSGIDSGRIRLVLVTPDTAAAESERGLRKRDDDHQRNHRHHSERFSERRPGMPRRQAKRAAAMKVAIQLDDGRWLNITGAALPVKLFWQWSTVVSLASAALILSFLMVFMVRRITRPLASLAHEAERFGRGEIVPALAEQGPEDIRHTIRAFNRMRERLERYVQDRTQMLAAVSHDLRTPITALRLRAELIDDVTTRDKILATLEEMQRMTESTLAFVREEAVQEETRWVDLTALVESLCDDLADMGQAVSFSGPGKTPYRCRPVSLRRALRNLIENAVTYGQRARVVLATESSWMCISIDDDGPGIAAEDLERVFEPFVRIETSRSRDTGGVGLGMAIARSIVRRYGGDIILENQVTGGLRVTVRLPIDKPNTYSPQPY